MHRMTNDNKNNKRKKFDTPNKSGLLSLQKPLL